MPQGEGSSQSALSALCEKASEEAYIESVRKRFEQLVIFLHDAKDDEDEKVICKENFKNQMKLCKEALETCEEVWEEL